MIVAQMNDPAAIPPASLNNGAIQGLRSEPPAAPDARAVDREAAGSGLTQVQPRESARSAHPGFGPLALPALVAATRVMRGGTGQRG